MTAIGIWSLEVAPGTPKTFHLPADVRITNVALDETLADNNGRSVVKFTYAQPTAASESDDEEDEEKDEAPPLIATVVLASLTPGKIEQTTVDLILEEEEEYIIEVTGKNTVHLLGNYIDQNSNLPPPGYDDESDFDSDEDAYNLEDVSSDVEMALDPAELDDESDAERFEEITEEKGKITGTKRPLEADDSAPKQTKADKKKAKKLKAADGSAAPAPEGKEKPQEAAKDAKDKKQKKEGAKQVTTPSGLKYTDAKVGSGPKAKKGDTVQMRYIGKLANGKQFDANTKGKPFTFRLGVGEVIKGWDEGVAGMAAGGERTLVIPSKLGYGKRAIDSIPANSELHFEIKMVHIK